MKYPRFMKRINEFFGVATGFIIFLITVVLFYETFARGVFKSPNVWPLPLTQYLILWAAFIGSGFAFQEKGHVGVGFIRDIIGNLAGRTVKRTLAVISYLCCIFYICVLLRQTYYALLTGLRYNRLTLEAWQIPIAVLYAGVIFGSILMLTTLVFIILDLLTGSDEYLEI